MGIFTLIVEDTIIQFWHRYIIFHYLSDVSKYILYYIYNCEHNYISTIRMLTLCFHCYVFPRLIRSKIKHTYEVIK